MTTENDDDGDDDDDRDGNDEDRHIDDTNAEDYARTPTMTSVITTMMTTANGNEWGKREE